MFAKIARPAAILACALSLGACDTTAGKTVSGWGHYVASGFHTKSEPAPPVAAAVENTSNASCPPVVIVPDVRAIHQFMDEQAPRQDNAISAAVISKVSTACVRNGDNLAIDMDIAFRGVLGPKARMWNTTRSSFAYPYFVAITQPNGTTISKEIYGTTITFAKDQMTAEQHDHLHQVIPTAGALAPQQLMVGFQLTEAQLAYNRSLAGVQSQAATAVPAGALAPTPVTMPAAAAKAPAPVKKHTYHRVVRHPAVTAAATTPAPVKPVTPAPATGTAPPQSGAAATPAPAKAATPAAAQPAAPGKPAAKDDSTDITAPGGDE